MEIMDGSVLTEKVLVTKAIFTKLALSRPLFVENSCAEFHEKKTDSLVVDIASSMNKRTCEEREKTNKMQQLDVYYQLLSQHVSGIIMLIIRITKTVLLYIVYCFVSAGCGW